MSAVEDRLTDALAARAHLETVEEEVLRQRGEALRAAVEDDADSLDPRSPAGGDEALAVLVVPDALEARRRRRAVVLAAAAAALVLAAAALGVGRVLGGPAVSPASRAPAGFSILGVPGPPVTLPEGVPAPQGMVAGSLRELLLSAPLSAWIYTDDHHRACLLVAVPDPQESGSVCGDRDMAEDPGIALGLADVGLTVRLVPDHLAPSFHEEGLVPVAPNLWVDSFTAARVAAADLRGASADTFVVQPLFGTGTVDLPSLDQEGSYAVLLRCLTTSSVQVEVSGSVQRPDVDCADGWSAPAGYPAAWFQVGSSPVMPVTVTVQAPEGASWEVGVVRCTSLARQCPAVPTTPTG